MTGVEAKVEGRVAALFHDLIDAANEGNDKTTYQPRDVFTVFKTCEVQEGGWNDRDDVSDLERRQDTLNMDTKRRMTGNTWRPPAAMAPPGAGLLMRWLLFALALAACEDGPTRGAPPPEPPQAPRESDIKLPDLIVGVGDVVVLLDVSVLFTGDPFTFSANSSDTTVVAVLLTPPPLERTPSYRLTISALAPGVAQVRVQADGYQGSWAAQTSHVTVIPDT